MSDPTVNGDVWVCERLGTVVRVEAFFRVTSFLAFQCEALYLECRCNPAKEGKIRLVDIEPANGWKKV